ncbi:hypothetical protein JCM10213v2_009068 [Rhodosporidiobolus nylandii]
MDSSSPNFEPKKRQARAPLACTRCKARKKRCDAETNPAGCTSCLAAGVECRWVDPITQKEASSGYARQLEEKIAALELALAAQGIAPLDHLQGDGDKGGTQVVEGEVGTEADDLGLGFLSLGATAEEQAPASGATQPPPLQHFSLSAFFASEVQRSRSPSSSSCAVPTPLRLSDLAEDRIVSSHLGILHLVLAIGAAVSREFAVAAALRRSAIKLLPLISQHHDLVLVQISILFTVYSLFTDDGMSPVAMSSLTIRLCTELGLHAAVPTSRDRSAALWTAFYIDQTLARALGRPPSIERQDISIPPPELGDEFSMRLKLLELRDESSASDLAHQLADLPSPARHDHATLSHAAAALRLGAYISALAATSDAEQLALLAKVAGEVASGAKSLVQQRRQLVPPVVLLHDAFSSAAPSLRNLSPAGSSALGTGSL